MRRSKLPSKVLRRLEFKRRTLHGLRKQEARGGLVPECAQCFRPDDDISSWNPFSGIYAQIILINIPIKPRHRDRFSPGDSFKNRAHIGGPECKQPLSAASILRSCCRSIRRTTVVSPILSRSVSSSGDSALFAHERPIALQSGNIWRI